MEARTIGGGCSCSSSGKAAPEPAAVTRVLVIVGATGTSTGKTKLSIDAAIALGGTVVNADKIQLYAGLDITTNKVPLPDCRGVPHHLLGVVPPAAGELPPSSYRSLAAKVATSVAARSAVPVVASGSNSLVHALLTACPGAAPADPVAPSSAYRLERATPSLRRATALAPRAPLHPMQPPPFPRARPS